MSLVRSSDLYVVRLVVNELRGALSFFYGAAVISIARIRAAMRAFVVHLCLSLVVAVLMALLVLGVWFPYPLRYLLGGLDLFWILIGIDVICGPLLTALLFNPSKPRRELIVDLSLVVAIQLAALVYGVYSIGQARPVALVFESDRFVAVSAAQIDAASLPEALPPWQILSWSGPILLGTRKARDGAETLKSIELSLRGLEPSVRPGWWQAYEESRPLAKLRMKNLSSLRTRLSHTDQTAIDRAIQKSNLPLDQLHYLPLVSQKELDGWIALLDGQADVIGYVPVDGFD